MPKKRKVTLPAKVQKIIPGRATEPEKAQIVIAQADPLYRELRVENKLTGEDGQPNKLREGEEVEVTVESEQEPSDRKSS